MFRFGRCGYWAVLCAAGFLVTACLPELSRSETRPGFGLLGRASAEFEDRIVLIDQIESTQRPQKRSWGSEQAEGPPDVKQAGDNGLAWASQTTDGQREWLLCSYEAPLRPRAVLIHATYNPGAIVQVSVLNDAGDETIAWDGEDPTPRDQPRGVSVIPVKIGFPVRTVRLTLDSPAVPGWNEIDAVGVEDLDGFMHWASHVEASSVYGSSAAPMSPANNKRAYSPEQATGEPDAAGPGDQSSAWASASPDNQAEWLICEYKTPQIPAEILVYENNAPGAITKVSVFGDDDQEVTIFEGDDPTPRGQPWGISVFPVEVDFPFHKLKLYVNSQEVPGYNEIDAVGLRAASGEIQWASGAQASSSFGAPPPVTPPPQMMRPPTDGDRDLLELQKQLQSLRQQVEELQEVREDLNELKELLKEQAR